MQRYICIIFLLIITFSYSSAKAENNTVWSITEIYGNAGRINNIKLAVKAINNVIIPSGKEFSYNSVVGERTAERGFKEAVSIFKGQHVTTIGGGICQVSSTLFKEVERHSKIKVTEHYRHSQPVKYGKNGADATVSWGTKDFRFVNQFPYPVRIKASIVKGNIAVRLVKAN